MTSQPPGDDWGDDRLAAAFDARAAIAPPTPSDLADEALARLSTVDRRRGRPWLLAAAAVVAVAVGLGGGSILVNQGHGPSGSPVAGSGNPPTAGPANLVREALGDPVTVRDALAIPDATQADREIVVEGFLSPLRPVPCPAPTPGTENPTFLRCPEIMQWLMEQPERLWTDEPGTPAVRVPSGPAFHPSFALVEPPTVPTSDAEPDLPIPVVLTGHFHDRRAALCGDGNRGACEATFVVDRVVEVNGAQEAVRTDRRTEAPPSDTEGDVDALVAVAAPDAIVFSRQLVTFEQVLGIEPILGHDQVIPNVDPSTLMWLVTVLDIRDGALVARTFALWDGSNWFAEITADGAHMLDRAAPVASGGAQANGPTAEPGAFAAAPLSILGMRVQGVRAVTDQREAVGATDRSEYAIRAWYIGPRPGVACDPLIPSVHAPAPPCDEARHWLLDDPQRYGVEQGQLRRDPEQWPPVLNPLLPVDVPFDVGETWRGGVPVPQPVIVLGHFNDTRVGVYHGNVFFVIDALAWTRDRPVESLDRVVRLTTAATDDPAAAVARIEAVSPNAALATWTTVVDAADLAVLEARGAAADAPELTSGPPVWIVRRLIVVEDDLGSRLAVESGYTADRSARVWLTPSPDSSADLATSIDLHDLDANTTLLRVFDYARQITSARPVALNGTLVWQRIGPVRDLGIDVAKGRNDHEVAIRWKGAACDPTWRILVRELTDGWILLEPYGYDDCESDSVVRQVVIVFDHPVDLDRIRTSDPCCG